MENKKNYYRDLLKKDVEVKSTLERINSEKGEAEPKKEGIETQGGQRVKPKKRKFKWYHGALIGAVSLGIVGTILQAKYNIGGKALDRLKGLGNNNTNKDSITQVLDNLPLDDNGIISVTVPMGVKPLDNEQTETFYFLADEEFAKYYVYDDGKQVELQEVTNDPRDNEKVQYFKTETGEVATGYIGIEDEYVEFLDFHDKIKDTISTTEPTAYSTPLNPVKEEVGDLYKVPDGYELYCEDETINENAKLAYVDYDEADASKEHYSEIYMIPEENLGNFIPVTKEAYSVLTNGDELKARLVETYEMYSQVKGNMGYGYEETTNRGR